MSFAGDLPPGEGPLVDDRSPHPGSSSELRRVAEILLVEFAGTLAAGPVIRSV